MSYKVINKENYYRKGVYNHFTKGAKCSMSMTAKIDVTSLFDFSKMQIQNSILIFFIFYLKYLIRVMITKWFMIGKAMN